MSRTRRRGPARFTRNQRDAHALFHLHAGGATILNLRHIPGDVGAEALLERGIVRVDRATKFGNPYPIGKRYGNRVQVVERYRQDLWRRIRSGDMPLEDLAALHGKTLACWCLPKRPCHAEVLARAAAWAAAKLAGAAHDEPPDS